MAARAGGRRGGDVVGEVSEALRAQIEEAVRGKNEIYFIGSGRKDFGDAGAVFLSEKLRCNTVVERLTLRFCKIGAVGARALAEVLDEQHNALKELDLYGNSLGDDGAEAMALMLRKNTTLEFFDLGFCGVCVRGARALGEALKANNTLKNLYLNYNDIGYGGAQALAEALRWNESLEELLLRDGLSDDGALSFLAALRGSNPSLTHLDFSFNGCIADARIMGAIQELLEENAAVVPETAERRARCLLFCCLQLAPTAHQHVVPSIGAVPVQVMRYAVEHAGKLHVAKRFEHGNLAAGQSSAGVRARS